MKKIVSLLLVMLISFGIMCVNVSAKSTDLLEDEIVGVIVEESDEEVVFDNEIATDNITNGFYNTLLSRSNYDLGTSGSINMTIKNFRSGSNRYSDYAYKTNSTKIKIKMSSNISIPVRVTLYNNSTGSQIGQTTVTVPNVGSKSVTFTNLTSSRRYYMRYENLGQQDVNITGKISAR